MKAMIFAAGLGTRLKPFTDNAPKALAPLAGRTLLYHVISSLKSAGVDEFVVNVHHFPDMIVSYLEKEFKDLDIKVSDERDRLLETGGGIRRAEALLSGDEPFLVHNVDIVSDLNLNWFESQFRPGAMAALLVSERKTRRYLLFNEDMRLVGWTDTSTGAVKTPFRNLDVTSCRKLAFGGIHLMSPDIFRTFDRIDNEPSAFPLYDGEGRLIEGSDGPLGERFPIMDYYLRAAASYEFIGAAPDNLVLIDAGKPESLAEAENFVNGRV